MYLHRLHSCAHATRFGGAEQGRDLLAALGGDPVPAAPLSVIYACAVQSIPLSSPLIIGIAGGTGSGKTTVAAKLAAAMPADRCVLIEHDSYYRDRSHMTAHERESLNYDHPDALDSELLARDLAELRAGRVVELPIYDHVTHTRRPERRPVAPAPVIIVEGILVFVDAALRSQFDIKLFVDTDADIRLMRRICRDLEERGRTFRSIRDQYYGSVRPMHLEFVEPSKRWADLIIPAGGNNEIALDVILGMLGHITFGNL